MREAELRDDPLDSVRVVTCATRQKLFPYSRIIIDVEYWFHFSMFDNLSYAAHSDYLVGWIARIKSFWGILQLQRL